MKTGSTLSRGARSSQSGVMLIEVMIAIVIFAFGILGIVSLLFGILVLVWPEISLGVLAILIAIWSILIGALQIIANVSLRRESGRSWVWGVIAGAIGVIFGIVVLIWPKAGVITLIWLLGIFALVFGVVLIVLGLQLRNAAKSIVAP